MKKMGMIYWDETGINFKKPKNVRARSKSSGSRNGPELFDIVAEI